MAAFLSREQTARKRIANRSENLIGDANPGPAGKHRSVSCRWLLPVSLSVLPVTCRFLSRPVLTESTAPSTTLKDLSLTTTSTGYQNDRRHRRRRPHCAGVS